jgi:alkylation response protein AidB-like acyl-CoA dehydrogenase
MYGGGAGFAQITHNLGTEEQQKWATFAAERGWGSTMVLTEPTPVPMSAPAAPRRSSRRRLVAHRRREAVHHLRRLR